MRRLILLAVAVTLGTTVLASAAALDVDGGVIQVFTFDAEDIGSSSGFSEVAPGP